MEPNTLQKRIIAQSEMQVVVHTAAKYCKAKEYFTDLKAKIMLKHSTSQPVTSE